MRKAQILVHHVLAGVLEEAAHGSYLFSYAQAYQGPPVSLTLPLKNTPYTFTHFPAFFEGLLPEGPALEALLRKAKIDKNDLFGQLLKVGQDVVGAVSIEEVK